MQNQKEISELEDMQEQNFVKILESFTEKENIAESIQLFDPSDLKQKYSASLQNLLEIRQQEHTSVKTTNTYQFLIKLFFDNLPQFPDQQHQKRLLNFFQKEKSQKIISQFSELFGINKQNMRVNVENDFNRRALKRALAKTYDNVLVNKHISNKRMYVLFCRKIMMELNNPDLVTYLKGENTQNL